MSQGTLTFNLMDPAEKKMFDAAPNGWRYKRVLEDLVKDCANGQTGAYMLRQVITLASQHGIEDIRDYARSRLAEGGEIYDRRNYS